jgi:hypothetical protein
MKTLLQQKTSQKASQDQLYGLIRRDNYDGNDPLDIEHYLRGIRREPITMPSQPPRQLTQPIVDLVSDNVSRNVVKNSMKKIQQNVKAAQISKQTLDDAMEQLIQEDVGTNLGKLAKGKSNTLKKAVVDEYKAKQNKISNFGKLTSVLKQQQHEQRLSAASVQPLALGTGTRSGAAYTATKEQLKTRLQLHKERNPN